MKKKFCSFLIMLLILTAMPLYFGTGALSVYAAENNEDITDVKVAHYNILGNVNMNRDYVLNDLLGFDPDLISLNEVDLSCYEDLIERFADKGYAQYGNSDWSPTSDEYIKVKAGWHNMTLYKTDKYELLDSGMFTLSDTPDDPHTFISYIDTYSRNYKEGRPRTCSWVYLEDKENGGKLIFASVHAQHAKSEEHDYNSIGLTILGEQLSKLKEEYNCNVICAGDLNSSKPEEVFEFGFSTSNNGMKTHSGGGALDSVLYSEDILLESFSVGERTQSDHMPVFTTLKVPVTKSLTDSEITLLIIIIAAVVVVAVIITIIVILTKKKKAKNKKAADERLAEMRAKLAEYEAANQPETDN